MAELVDALVSGTSIRKDVQVRVLFRAQNFKQAIACFFYLILQDEKFIRPLAEVLFRAQKHKQALACFFCLLQLRSNLKDQL